MLQLRTYVILRCDQCGDSPSSQARYATEDAALDAAAAEGWRIATDARLWCSACATVLTCEAEGHEFGPWRLPITSDGQLALSQYRHCQRCCLVDSRPNWGLRDSVPRQGKSGGFAAGAGTSVAEVA